MKQFFSGLAAVLLLAACSNNQTTANNETTTDSAAMSPQTNTEGNTASAEALVQPYLNLKNALAADDSKAAADAGGQMKEAITGFATGKLNSEQQKVYNDVKDDMQEHAEHIQHNNGNLAHQREHFEVLSNDLYDLVKATGTSQTLYRDYCPMYNNSKGGYWLSANTEIKNPYMGKKMETCGEVKDTLK